MTTAERPSFPEAPASTGTLAGFWPRAGAAILDGLLVTIVFGVLLTVGGLLGDDGGVAVGYGLGVLASFLYAPVLMLRKGASNGQTFGKQALGIRVVPDSGGPVTAGPAVLREVVGKGILGFLSIISVFMVAFRGDKKGIHDMLGSTHVERA